MALGKLISTHRRAKKMTQAALGQAVGMSQNTISAIESGDTTPSREKLIEISGALSAPEILVFTCDRCPIRRHIFMKMFPDLNNIRRDPAIVVSRLRKEMVEAADAAERLAERFSDADFLRQADYLQTFEKEMEQIIDVKRGIEILEFELILSGLHTQKDLDKVYDRQQRKCVEHGHHIPERTGTNG